MKGAIAPPESLDSLPQVREWLRYSRAAVQVVEELGKDMDDSQRMKLLLEQNVMLQLQHLKTHPSVAARLAKGDLQLHGWVYDIKTGGVSAYNEATQDFQAVAECYAEEIKKYACHTTH